MMSAGPACHFLNSPSICSNEWNDTMEILKQNIADMYYDS